MKLKKQRNILIYLVLGLLLFVVIFTLSWTVRGFHMTSVGGRVENISSADEYCLYYREARESLEDFLENQGFHEVEEFIIPSSGMHNVYETEDWYTVYEGSYKGSSDFYIYIVHNDNFNNDDRCDFSVDIIWQSTGFVWKLQKDEDSIKEFNFLIQDWWEEYKD